MSDNSDGSNHIELFGGAFDGKILEVDSFETSILLPIINVQYKKDGSVIPPDQPNGSSLRYAKYWLALIDDVPMYLSSDLRATDHFPWKHDDENGSSGLE